MINKNSSTESATADLFHDLVLIHSRLHFFCTLYSIFVCTNQNYKQKIAIKRRKLEKKKTLILRISKSFADSTLQLQCCQCVSITKRNRFSDHFFSFQSHRNLRLRSSTAFSIAFEFSKAFSFTSLYSRKQRRNYFI